MKSSSHGATAVISHAYGALCYVFVSMNENQEINMFTMEIVSICSRFDQGQNDGGDLSHLTSGRGRRTAAQSFLILLAFNLQVTFSPVLGHVRQQQSKWTRRTCENGWRGTANFT